MSKICTSKLGHLQGQGCIQNPPAASTPPHISQPRFDHRSCSRDILTAVQEHKTDHVGCLACGTLTTAATVLILLAMGRRPVLRVCLPRAATDFSHISSQHVTQTRPYSSGLRRTPSLILWPDGVHRAMDHPFTIRWSYTAFIEPVSCDTQRRA